MVKLVPRDNEHHTVDDYNRSWPHSQPLTTHGRARTRWLLNDRNLTRTASSTQFVKDLQVIIQSLCASIPPSVDAIQVMRGEHFGQIIHEYHLQRASYWFTLPPSSVAGSLFRQKSSIWVIYLGARLFQALGGNPHTTTVPRCINWIDKLEQKFACNFRNSSTQNDVAEWLLTQLEVAFLKFTAVGSGSGYLALKKALPVFLRLVAVDPSLHIERPRGDLVISFSRTFSAPRYEIQWFVVNDTITSLLLGVQPMVEYDYNSECDSTSHGLEWIHGIPVALAETISQVNSWRAGSRVAPLDDWRNLETRVLAWQSPRTVTEPQESGANITARLAIQEGWRHVTLIYIYMGMCGVSSHDQRVQTLIMHIMQLGEAVNDLPIGVHVFVHCVVVGLAARYERHRCTVHEKLLSFKGTRVWLFHGVEFGRILEHLWYGVGAGGGPVTWDDYVRSRCAVVPI
ncbi:fungal zn(2)-cys(6) binuclear cluster domain protein, putative [Rhizoctonia solani AG-3 Rhs1AP]|uniref:Fungal zn(2)-cys(6) binuclear cluster domain protein, putative n=1 Tax=Rhizoctonia solani AG-3 Rhs1AP TaxID=1086054 RepID=X8JDD7_9AGAM|nr:fungal zn(2)-cys(6) binuclear cluster domain protein, putative [Rhizoctonia solani AG-3 Rhs1AP]